MLGGIERWRSGSKPKAGTFLGMRRPPLSKAYPKGHRGFLGVLTHSQMFLFSGVA